MPHIYNDRENAIVVRRIDRNVLRETTRYELCRLHFEAVENGFLKLGEEELFKPRWVLVGLDALNSTIKRLGVAIPRQELSYGLPLMVITRKLHNNIAARLE